MRYIHFSTARNDIILARSLSSRFIRSLSPLFYSLFTLTLFIIIIIISQTASRQLRMMDAAVPFRGVVTKKSRNVGDASSMGNVSLNMRGRAVRKGNMIYRGTTTLLGRLNEMMTAPFIEAVVRPSANANRSVSLSLRVRPSHSLAFLALQTPLARAVFFRLVHIPYILPRMRYSEWASKVTTITYSEGMFLEIKITCRIYV